MAESKTLFSEEDIMRVAAMMHETSREYEQLFTNFCSQILSEISELEDASEIMTLCVKRIEETILAFLKHIPAPSVISCKKGCHYCCSFTIFCPPQVVVAIAHHIRVTIPEDEQQLLRQKLAGDIAVRNTPMKRARCPFLDETNACSIYEKRPLACRSFSSPNADICEQSVTDGRNIPQHPILHRIYMATTTALLLCAKHQGKSHEQVPFIPSLLTALETQETSTS